MVIRISGYWTSNNDNSVRNICGS